MENCGRRRNREPAPGAGTLPGEPGRLVSRTGGSRSGTARAFPSGCEEFVERAPCGIPQGGRLGPGAEDVPARGGQDLGIRRTERAPQVRGRGALGTQAGGQDGPADRCEVKIQCGEGGPHGGAHHQAHGTERTAVAPVLRGGRLGDPPRDRVRPADVLDGSAFRVGGQGKDEHAASGLGRQVQCRPE